MRQSQFTRTVPAAMPGSVPVTGKGPVAYAPPARAKTTSRGKQLAGLDVVVDSAVALNEWWIDPIAKVLRVHANTWSWSKNDNAVMGHFVHEKAEAVRQMKVTMFDVSAYAPAVDGSRQPAPPLGITLLCRDLEKLVQRLAALDTTDPKAVQSAAAEYGKHRDTMARLRAAFDDAEGRFDTAQALLLQKMGLDDE